MNPENQDHRWVIRYSEIGLKGGNRRMFEQALLRDLRRRLKLWGAPPLDRIHGRIWVEDRPEYRQQIKNELSSIPGIQNFSLAKKCSKELKCLEAKCAELLQEEWDGKSALTFRISTQRSDKTYAMRSMELNRHLGATLIENHGNGLLKVKLQHPDLDLGVEIHKSFALVHISKIAGVGGLPIGTAGRVLCLLSGGIDSPVAAWQMMRRGCKVDFIFFENRTFLGRAAYDKVELLAKHLAHFQGRSRLCVVPFANIQVAIRDACRAKNRVVLYRRFMYRLAEQWRRKNRALALVTGENIGQVASQTLENLNAVQCTVDSNVYRPLLCLDKLDIIRIAKKIGTYQVSIEDAPDCCSVFLPDKPVTRARIAELEDDETHLDMEALMSEALEKVEVLNFS